MSSQGIVPPARTEALDTGSTEGWLTHCVRLLLVVICSSSAGARGIAGPTSSCTKRPPMAASRRRCAWLPAPGVGVRASGRTLQAQAGRGSAELASGGDRSDEITWMQNGTRVAFLVNGTQLRMYDAEGGAPAGLLDLLPADGPPSTRVARGVTFSETGAAITFDDCRAIGQAADQG